MKKIAFTFLCTFVWSIYFAPLMVMGQELDSELLLLEEKESASEFKAVIESRKVAGINQDIVFDAGNSLIDENKGVLYKWDFGDGNREQGEKVLHSFSKHGNYKIKLSIERGDRKSEIESSLFVYDKSYLFLTNNEAQTSKIDDAYNYAKNVGVYLKIIESYEAGSDFLSEEILIRKLSESIEEIRTSDRIIIWTRSSVGLTILSSLSKLIEERNISLEKKSIIVVTEGNLDSVSTVARGLFNSIKPGRIVLTRSEALFVIDAVDMSSFYNNLNDRGIDYAVIEGGNEKMKLRNFMSYLVNFMIEKGIPSNTVKLILVLPIIATVVAFMKQVVGVATLGVYTPSIITLSFIALDLKFGLLILLILLFVGTIARMVLSRYRLLYIPRMAILLTIASLTIFLVLILGAYFNISEIVSISIFPMLMMSTLVEKFVSIQTGQGFKSALLLIGETILVSVICYYVAEWDFVKTLVLGNPEVIFLFLLFNIFLGRWTGLRVFEYIRFREVIRYAEEE